MGCCASRTDKRNIELLELEVIEPAIRDLKLYSLSCIKFTNTVNKHSKNFVIENSSMDYILKELNLNRTRTRDLFAVGLLESIFSLKKISCFIAVLCNGTISEKINVLLSSYDLVEKNVLSSSEIEEIFVDLINVHCIHIPEFVSMLNHNNKDLVSYISELRLNSAHIISYYVKSIMGDSKEIPRIDFELSFWKKQFECLLLPSKFRIQAFKISNGNSLH